MINQERLQLFLQSLTKDLLGDGKPSSKITFQDDNATVEKEVIFGSQRHLNNAKESIVEILKTIKSVQNLNEDQFTLLISLKNSLKMLNQDLKYLLEQGILILALNLNDLRQKIAKDLQQTTLLKVVKQITITLTQLLKKYFVYQEYKKRKERKQLSISAFKFLSEEESQKQNCVPSKLESRLDLELLKDIESSLNSFTVQQLIENYLENEIESIRQTEETCKICFKKIKIQSIERHVRLCSKNSNLKQRLSEIKIKYDSLKRQITQKLKQINQMEIKTDESESLKKVIAAFLKDEMVIKKDKVRVRKRSGTMLETNTDKSLKVKWEFMLFEHQQFYGEEQTSILNQFLSLQKERMIIQQNLADIGSMIESSEHSNGTCSNKKIGNLDNMFQKSTKSMKYSQKAKSKNQLLDSSNYDKLSKEDCIINSNDSFLEIKNSKPSRGKRMSQQLQLNTELLDKIMPPPTTKLLKKCTEVSEPKSFGSLSSGSKHYVSLQHISLSGEKEKEQISIDSFQILKVLGKGAFGKVYLVRRKETEDAYALKIISISEDVSQKQLQNIKTEHQIFKKIAGDHLVKAPFSFSQKGCHVFVMELMPGGDLHKILAQQVYFEQPVAQFYLAEIVLAIEHLHQYDIIHRDLKPENIVLDQEGHIKLTDFGLSAMTLEKRLEKTREIESTNQKKKSRRRVGVSFKNIQGVNLIGTPDYIAPEIINHISTQNKTIDWWSLGVMAYELLIGTRPFSGDTIEEVLENIHNFNIDWPQVGSEDGISAAAKDFIEKLLNKNFALRLGFEGVEEIKSHPFFQGIDWENIKQQKPPIQPNISEITSRMKDSQDQSLKQQVEKRVNAQKNHAKKLNLQNFVRYDLLGTQTMQTVGKIVSEKKQKLKRLQTYMHFDENKTNQFKSPSINNASFM